MSKLHSRKYWFLSLGALFLTHCSDAGDPATNGTAGTGTTAGTAPTAGTSASAGQGGTTATAGTTSGQAGVATSGAGGAAGSAAGANVGGAAAGSGGAGGSLGAGGHGGGGGSGNGGGSGGGGPFKLTSSEHAEGAVFADALTCAGVGRSPALAWTAGPAGTKSYAITFLDETLTATGNANGYHYVIWDIPATTLALPANLPSGATLTTPVVAKQFSPMNGFDHLPANTYFGPCPNAVGSGNTDTYAFTLYALPVEQLTGTLNGVKAIETAIKAANPLATSALHGTSTAKPN